MTIRIEKPDEQQLKHRLLNIYHLHKCNRYYIANPSLFSKLIMLIEDFPEDYMSKLSTDFLYIDVKEWIQSMFIIEKQTEIELSLENEVQFVLNDIVDLPFCKCKVKLQLISDTKTEAV